MEQKTQFSKREREVIELLLRGKSNKQIALALGVSVRTVEFHLSNIYAKLGVTSRTEAALKLTESGLRESTGGELRESTVVETDKAAENGGTPLSTRRIPMKNFGYIIGGGLLTTALVVMLVLANLPAKGADVAPTAQASVTPALEQPAETTSFSGGLVPNWQEVTYTSYDFNSLIDVCETLVRQVVIKEGGRIEKDANGEDVLVIPVRPPQPGLLEQSWAPGPVANTELKDKP